MTAHLLITMLTQAPAPAPAGGTDWGSTLITIAGIAAFCFVVWLMLR